MRLPAPLVASGCGLDPQAAALALENALGDPFSGGAMTFSRAVELDEREAFPEKECRALDALGLNHHYVPVEFGGRLSRFDELTQLIRQVARRDLTVAIAHGKSFLAAAPVWLAGSEAQKRRLAEALLSGVRGALCLTEAGHGTDLQGVETLAETRAGGYSLSGEKWLINNATRGRALVVLARTAPEPGPRAGSLFLVDKASLEPGSFEPLAKIRTHGIRGADISGIRFLAAALPADALIGAPGHGLEIALKGLLVTRSLISALSLGAADTALRVVVDFARARRVRDRAVAELPHARALLAHAFADLLACEALSFAAARSLHVVPGQVSLFSAAAKYIVPTTVDRILGELSVVLGARHYLRQGHVHGIFQKLVRDAALVSLFDGSTVVNLSALALQIPRLAARRQAGGPVVDLQVAERRRALFGFMEPLPALAPARLSLVSRGRDDVLEALPLAAEELLALGASSAEQEQTHRVLARLVTGLASALRDESRLLHELERGGAGGADSPEMFALAGRHAALFAGATCLHLWLANRDAGDAFLAKGAWLVVALARLLERAGCPEAVPASYRDSLFLRLIELDETNRSFSLFPLALAPRAAPRG
jgi:alkylation response protein AidB-like acyl-CoA dehydrogenase